MQATYEGANALGYEQYTPIGEKSVLNFPHQFGLIDSLCGLYFPYRDEYEFTVTYPSTSNSLDGYKHGKDYLTGQLDLGVLGKVQIAVFQKPEKQNEQSPDATIHLFEGD